MSFLGGQQLSGFRSWISAIVLIVIGAESAPSLPLAVDLGSDSLAAHT